MEYTIGAASKRTGISSYTLRYYDKKGLLPFVNRDDHGRRYFKEHDFDYLSTINCLKRTDMSLKDIKSFINWCQDGDRTLEKRRDFLISHRKEVEKHLQEVQGYLDQIDNKIDYYSRAYEKGTEDGVEC